MVAAVAVAAIGIVVSAVPYTAWGREALALWRARSAAMPALSPGDTTIIYGPEVFSTPTGSQTTSIETFTATPAAGQRYSVIMEKGSGSLTTADVFFNGLQIASISDFQSVNTISEVVNLLPSDTVKVVLAGAAGATLTVTVIADPSPDYAIYGVQRFVKQGGGSTSEQFSRPSDAAGPYLLSVVNGPPGSGGRVSSGSIKIDNVEMATPSEFNQNVAGFVKEISLSAGQHTITVSLSGANGKAIDVLITARDTTPPVISLTVPQQNTITSATSISVSGSVTDQTQTSVTVNGNAATMNGTSFSASAALTSEGQNTITVRAKDGAFLTTDSVRTVIRDTQAPSLTVSSPADGLVTNQPQVTVSGTVSDLTAVTVNVNGTPVTVSAGAFSTSFTLAEGSNVITVSATDAASNVTSIVRQVTKDTQAPALTVSSPVDQTTTGEASITVSGTVSDATAVTVAANGVALSVLGNGNFSGSVPLTVGENTITTVATDAAGNTTSVPRVVTREQGEEIGGPLPIDSSLNAPAPDPTQSVSFLDATAFLYTGAGSVQTGVSAGTIQAQSAAVVRGRVLSRGGIPIAGVTVSIIGHPEFGSTTTRTNGLFDMVVNGGGPLRVGFTKTGYLPVERQVHVPWGQYIVVDDVVQVQLDAQSTTVDFSDPIEVAAGSVVADSRGTRQAVAMFEQGTTATLVLPNGSTQPASSLTVRATEYTVGAAGPNAMPGLLPATSAYTYAVELSADEAIAAGAKSVTFSKPVAFYVDNFIGCKTGIAVPTGWFDRTEGEWKGSADGRVIKIVGVTNGKADIAIDSTEVAASDSILGLIGFTTAEREELAQRYSVGKSLWRVEVTHFTPFDLNWYYYTFGLNPWDPRNWPRIISDFLDKITCKEPGSVIGCENQTLGEVIDLPGSGGFALHYQSERNKGYTVGQRLRWKLLGDTVPTNLDSIIVGLTVGGRGLLWRFGGGDFPPGFTFRADLGTAWDGKDAYGRPVSSGTHRVKGTIRYIFGRTYSGKVASVGGGGGGSSFGVSPSGPSVVAAACDPTASGCNARLEITHEILGSIQKWDARETHGLGGWTLTPHHALDVVGGELLLGDGSSRTASDLGLVTRTVAGNGVSASTGDGGPATSASISSAVNIALNAEGSLFIAEWFHNRVRRVSPAGIINQFGPLIPRPENLSIGPDGSLYLSTADHKVYRMDAVTGDTSTLAGGGLDYTTDGIDAKQARFFGIMDLAAAPDGSVYVYHLQTRQIRRVMPDGRIYTAAGNGIACGAEPLGGEGLPAPDVKLCDVRALTVTPSGELYYVDNQWSGRYLRKVRQDGRVSTVVGTAIPCASGQLPCGDNGPASLAALNPLTEQISAAPDGSILLADWERVRRIGPDGIISTIFGTPALQNAYDGDGVPTLQTKFQAPLDAELGPDGKLYVLDQSNRVVRGLPPFATFGTQNINIASQDGQELYVFSPTGRHLETKDALTGRVLITFGYDVAGRLVTVTDVHGNVTTVQRDGTGKPTAIVGPFGQTNTITLDSNGYLQSVTNPKGEVTLATHGSTGLLATLTDPKGNPPHEFTYGESGWLVRDEDPTGGFKTLSRAETDSGFTVTLQTGMGRKKTFAVQQLADSTVQRRITDPAGLVTRTIEGSNKTVTVVPPAGDTLRMTLVPDPRWGMQVPVTKELTVTTPGRLQSVLREVRIANLTDPDDPLSLVTLTDSVIVNGRVSTGVYDAATRTHTATSPQGRQAVTVLDTLGRVVEERVAWRRCSTPTARAASLECLSKPADGS